MKTILTYTLLSFTMVSFAQTWTTYDVSNSNLVSNNVNRIRVDDSNGDVLVSTQSGFNIKSGSTWTVHTVGTGALGNNSAVEPLRDGANIWVGTDGGGISKYDGSSWTIYNTSNSALSDNKVYDNVKAPNGMIWLGTRDGGLCAFNGTVFTPVSIASNISVTFDRAHSIDIDANGILWIGTAGGGLAQYNPANGVWAQYTTSNSTIPHNDVYAVKIAADGKIWAGTNGGVAIFDPMTSQFTAVLTTVNSMLPGNYIRSIDFDWSGRGYIATAYGGVARVETNYTINTVWNSSNSTIPSDTIWDLNYGDGRLWVATLNEGIAVMDIDVSVPEVSSNLLSFAVVQGNSSGNSMVVISSSANMLSSVELYSQTGQLVWAQHQVALVANTENRVTMPLGSFAKGTYIVVVRGDKGEQSSKQIISE